MVGEIENAARSMMSSPQGIKIVKGLDKYNAAMNTEAGRQLIALLGGGGGDALKAAAAQAATAAKDPAVCCCRICFRQRTAPRWPVKSSKSWASEPIWRSWTTG